MRRFLPISLCLIAVLTLSGFDFTKHTIPIEDIKSGGPPKDGIPALTDPEWLNAKEAAYLNPEDRVIGFVQNGDARAYPIRILNWHEVVNDEVAGIPITVVYCPLCGSGTVFDARVKQQRAQFGVSGLLYNSDVLIYDKGTESLWSQIKMEAVTGTMTGTRLKLLDSSHTTWADWSERYPHTRVLSLETGYRRDYARDPYQSYGQVHDLFFPVNRQDSRLHPKTWVLGVQIGEGKKAYMFEALAQLKEPLSDELGGKEIKINFDRDHDRAWVTDVHGKSLPSIRAYWFAWYAFYPNTELYKGS